MNTEYRTILLNLEELHKRVTKLEKSELVENYRPYFDIYVRYSQSEGLYKAVYSKNKSLTGFGKSYSEAIHDLAYYLTSLDD